jgi:hypothetical protein
MTSDDLEGLIKALLDARDESGDRDDVAMTLASSDQPEAEAALLTVATDPSSDPDLSDRCGESLALIWSRRGDIDVDTIAKLNVVARRVALGTINALSPSLSERLASKGVIA